MTKEGATGGCSFLSFCDDLEGFVTRFEEQACAGFGIGLVRLQFDGIPVDLVGTLCEGGMRDQ